MLTIREYKKAESLEEAYTLNQKKSNRVIGGMIWLKMENINVGTAIDLSGLELDTIEETEGSFSIGAMVTLRQLEEHAGLAAYTHGAVKGSAAAYRGRAAAQSGNCGWQHLQPVRLFRCAHAVYGHGLFGGVVQGWDHIPAGVC
mgnify:CR=1 FL=1